MVSSLVLSAVILIFFYTLHLSIATNNVAQRMPLGGSLFQMESRALLSRQDPGDLGSDCSGDLDCPTKGWGCQCGFEDSSWMPDIPAASTPTSVTPQQTCFSIMHDDLNFS